MNERDFGAVFLGTCHSLIARELHSGRCVYISAFLHIQNSSSFDDFLRDRDRETQNSREHLVSFSIIRHKKNFYMYLFCFMCIYISVFFIHFYYFFLESSSEHLYISFQICMKQKTMMFLFTFFFLLCFIFLR